MAQKPQELILGIYTPLEWHEHSHPRKADLFPGCSLCRKAFRAKYMKWWREKRKLEIEAYGMTKAEKARLESKPKKAYVYRGKKAHRTVRVDGYIYRGAKTDRKVSR